MTSASRPMQAQNTQIRTAFIPNVIKPTSAHNGGSARGY
jgi:hypothetical protein